jgi:hypothetical protein
VNILNILLKNAWNFVFKMSATGAFGCTVGFALLAKQNTGHLPEIILALSVLLISAFVSGLIAMMGFWMCYFLLKKFPSLPRMILHLLLSLIFSLICLKLVYGMNFKTTIPELLFFPLGPILFYVYYFHFYLRLFLPNPRITK